MIHHSPPFLVIDAAALVALLGSLVGEIPTIMGGMAALYYVFAIFDLFRKWYKG